MFFKTPLRIDELADFLDSHSDKALKKVNNKVIEIKKDNKNIIDHLQYLLETINPYNIKTKDEKEFNLMKVRIHDVQTRVEELLEGVYDESHHIRLRDQTAEFIEKVNAFIRDIKDPLLKIEDHFKDLVPVLVSKVHDLKTNMENLKMILDQEIVDEYYNLYDKLATLKDRVKQDEESEKARKKLNTDLVKHKARLEELKNKKHAMSLTESFKMSEKTYNDIKDLKTKIEMKNKDVDSIFASLKPLLKVYNQKYRDRIIDNYVNNPSDALLNDYDLKIEKEIKKIQKMIKDEKIKITKDKDKILRSIKESSSLKNIKKELAKLDETIQKKRLLLAKNKIMLDILELDYQIDHVQDKIISHESELMELTPYGVDESEIPEILKKVSKMTGRRIKLNA